MFEANHKSLLYKKIILQSPESRIRINCRSKPEFLYDMKDVVVCSLTDDYNINNNFIDVVEMKHCNNGEKLINLESGSVNSYFTLKPDFSNIFEISDKFNALVESLSKSFEWKQLYLETDCVLNYIKYYERDSSKFVGVYVNGNFKDFDDLEKYDFIVTEKINPSSSGKIMFDGEFLEMDNYIIKFIKKPTFDKFIVDLDNRINDIIFEIPYEHYILKLITHYMQKNCKYNIYFRPSKIEHFLYLKLLNDINWLGNRNDIYTEADILTKMYNI